MWTSHLIIRSHHTYRHPVSVSTDTERIPAAVCHRGNILLVAERIGKQKMKTNWTMPQKMHHYGFMVSKTGEKTVKMSNQPVAEVVLKVSSNQRHGELVSPIRIKHIKFLWGWRSHFIGAGSWSQRACRWRDSDWRETHIYSPALDFAFLSQCTAIIAAIWQTLWLLTMFGDAFYWSVLLDIHEFWLDFQWRLKYCWKWCKFGK